MGVPINVDVPDLRGAVAFYTGAFGLAVRRRLGARAAEPAGWPVPLFLLRHEVGSVGAGDDRRIYERHWTPVHLDVVVDDIAGALSRAVGAGARVGRDVRTEVWGKIAVLADPFGHGLCPIESLNRGYDEIARG